MPPAQLAIYGTVAFFMSILSGIAGAGGGFVITPLAILLGLSPAQAVSSGKFNGVALTIGSLSGLRKQKGRVSKRTVLAIMVLAFAIGLVAPYLIKSLESRWYQLALGIIILVMIPIVIYKHIGTIPRVASPARKTIGGFLLAVSLFLQGTFSSGLGSLVNLVLMSMVGLTANEANLTKRYSQLVLNLTIIVGLLTSGLIVWPVVAVGAPAALCGGFIGGRIAVKKGDQFAVAILLVLMGASALVLIAEAL